MSPKLADGAVVMFPSDAIALGRFGASGALGYIAATAPNAQVRINRDEAIEDERAHFEMKWADVLTPVSRNGSGVSDTETGEKL